MNSAGKTQASESDEVVSKTFKITPELAARVEAAQAVLGGIDFTSFVKLAIARELQRVRTEFRLDAVEDAVGDEDRGRSRRTK